MREHHDVWLQGVARIEWPDRFPAIEPMIWAPTKRALDEGITEIPPDSEIYLALTRKPDSFQAGVGSAAEIIKANTVMLASAAQAPIQTTCVNLRAVYEMTLAAAVKAGVDLGAPFTRPEGHDEHREWFAAIEVHRALAAQRLKMRKPSGPAPAKSKPKAKKRPAQASSRQR